MTKHSSIAHGCLSSGLIMLLLSGLSACSTHSPNKTATRSPPIQLGSVWVDPAKQELSMSGNVNQVVGLIELLVCGSAGKTHESAFVVQAKPVDIHTGLLLLGLKHGEPMPGIGEGPPLGDSISLEIEWMNGTKLQREPAAKFMYNIKTDKAVQNATWIFNGSMVNDGHYMAKMEDSIVATYWDPWAIINIGNEQGGDDECFVINRKTIPPLHTPVRVIMKPADK